MTDQETRELILSKARSGVTTKHIDRDRRIVARILNKMVKEGVLFRQPTFDPRVVLFFDSRASASQYRADTAKMKPVKEYREIEANPETQVIPGIPYIPFNPSLSSSGYYTQI